MNSMIYNPLEEFDSKFKNLHLDNTQKYFKELVQKSGVNIEENRKTVKEHAELKENLSKIRKKYNLWRFLRVLMIITLILIPLVIIKITPKIRALRKEIEEADKKIEELFAQVDKIEEEKQSLLKLIDKAKDKVLDLAMKGKLVKQDHNDEPASVLLEKIFDEKKKLAKEGKIKLSKDELLEPQISDDNDYYKQFIEPQLILKYPKVDNWNKLTLNQICTSISTKEYQIKSSDIKSIGEYPVISQGEQFIDGYCETTKYLDKIPCIIFGDHTRVVKYIDFPFVVGADGTKCLYSYINHKFFYYLIKYYSSFRRARSSSFSLLILLRLAW